MASDQPEPPLDYRNPDDDRDPNSRSTFVAGFFAGGIAVAAIGFVVFCATVPVHRPRATSFADRHQLPVVALFAAAFALAVGGVAWPGSSARRRSYLQGLLIGVFVLSLVEGTCFFNP